MQDISSEKYKTSHATTILKKKKKKKDVYTIKQDYGW